MKIGNKSSHQLIPRKLDFVNLFHFHLTITASLALLDALFYSRAPNDVLFLLLCTRRRTIFTEGPEGPFHAPCDALFLLKGPKGPSVHPATHYFYSRAQMALPCTPRRTIFTEGPEGPFRVLEKAGR